VNEYYAGKINFHISPNFIVCAHRLSALAVAYDPNIKVYGN